MKLLRKLNFIFLVVITFSCFFNNCKAATKEDVIAAINKTYIVGDETFRLPQNIINKGINYLNKNPLTEAQYDRILNCISKGVAFANEVGTTNIDEISDEDLDKAFMILAEAADSANIDLNEELAENNIPIGKVETPNNNVLPDSNENETNKPTNINSNNNTEKNNISKPENINNSNNIGVNDNKSNDVKLNDNSNDKLNNGELIDNPDSSGEKIKEEISSGDNIQHEKEDNKKVDNTAFLKRTKEITNKSKKIYYVALGIIIILFILFIFIFRLILKIKGYRILKCILLVLVSIIVIALLTSVILAIIYQKKIVVAVKLYYILK